MPTLAALSHFDWYGVRGYSIKQCFTLHRFLLKSLRTSKLFIDVCSNLHLAKEAGAPCEGEGEHLSAVAGGLAQQRLEELVFHVHLFTCPSSLMELSREGWIGLKVAELQRNCTAAAQRVLSSVRTSKIPLLSFLFQLRLLPIGGEKRDGFAGAYTVNHQWTNYPGRKQGSPYNHVSVLVKYRDKQVRRNLVNIPGK